MWRLMLPLLLVAAAHAHEREDDQRPEVGGARSKVAHGERAARVGSCARERRGGFGQRLGCELARADQEEPQEGRSRRPGEDGGCRSYASGRGDRRQGDQNRHGSRPCTVGAVQQRYTGDTGSSECHPLQGQVPRCRKGWARGGHWDAPYGEQAEAARVRGQRSASTGVCRVDEDDAEREGARARIFESTQLESDAQRWMPRS